MRATGVGLLCGFKCVWNMCQRLKEGLNPTHEYVGLRGHKLKHQR
jgi:hypothetical protein